MDSKLKCSKCHAEINWVETHCLKCKEDLGPPNQRELKQKAEKKALKKRYLAEIGRARQQNIAEQQIMDFEQAVKTKSKAVVNLSAALLNDFMSGNSPLYSNYNLQTQGEIRKVAKMQDDK